MPTNQAVGNTKDYNQYSDLNETDMQGGQEPLKIVFEESRELKKSVAYLNCI
uniref:Uncharacterized protein n=1 Tax=Physcomitrium patens TaxID=3218 RepID=A0A7I4F799_PHYPA